jgi:hypothetical protein
LHVGWSIHPDFSSAFTDNVSTLRACQGYDGGQKADGQGSQFDEKHFFHVKSPVAIKVMTEGFRAAHNRKIIPSFKSLILVLP